MALINRVPQGFLGLLDTKTLGQNPSDLSNTIVPTVDLKELFLSNSGLKGDGVTAAGVTSASLQVRVADVTVPAGELWFVVSASSKVLVGLTGGLDFAVDLVIDTPNFQEHILASVTPQNNASLSTGESIAVVANFSPALIAPPGTTFGSVPTRAFPSGVAVDTSVLHYTVQV